MNNNDKKRLLSASYPNSLNVIIQERFFFDVAVFGEHKFGRWIDKNSWDIDGPKIKSWLATLWQSLEHLKTDDIIEGQLKRLVTYEKLTRGFSTNSTQWRKQISEEREYILSLFNMSLSKIISNFSCNNIYEHNFRVEDAQSNPPGVIHIACNDLALPAFLEIVSPTCFDFLGEGAEVFIYDFAQALPGAVERYINFYKRDQKSRDATRISRGVQEACSALLKSAKSFVDDWQSFSNLPIKELQLISKKCRGIDPMLPGKSHFRSQSLVFTKKSEKLRDFLLMNADILPEANQYDFLEVFINEIIIHPIEQFLNGFPHHEKGRIGDPLLKDLVVNLANVFDSFSGWWRTKITKSEYRSQRRHFVHKCLEYGKLDYGHSREPDPDNSDSMNKDLPKIPKEILTDIGSQL